MLVASTALSFIAPIAAQASDTFNIEEINSYSRSKKKSTQRFDSKTFVNKVNEDLAALKGRLDGLEALQNNLEAGSFSDTTTLDGKAIFTLFGSDHSKVQADGTDSIKASYTYQMNLNTSFTGDDNLYVRIKTGNHSGKTVNKTHGTYLSSGNSAGDALTVDKIWYTFPVGDSQTVWIGPKIENYYMHGTTPSIYKPVTKQFTLGGNGEAYGASTNSGVGWAYKADNGFALSSNVVSKQNLTSNGLLTNQAATSWASQIGFTKPNYSASVIYNVKTSPWSDTYYHVSGHGGSTISGHDEAGNYQSIGLRGWWRPEAADTAMPSISLGLDMTSYDGVTDASNSSNAWFAGFSWTDLFQADDRVGIAFGQPTTNEATTTDPFAYELYYSFQANDSITVTPAIFGGMDRNGTADDDIVGAVLETTFKF